MPTKRIPLVGSLINRNLDVSSSKDQRFENCYPEVTKNPVTGDGGAYLYKRPGFLAANNADASYVGTSGVCNWSAPAPQKLMFCYLNGTTLLVYDTAGNSYGGTLSNISGTCHLSETILNGTDKYLVLIATKTTDSLPHAYFLAEGGPTWTEITDTDYPTNQTPALTTTGNAVHMNGYMYIMDTNGKIWNSELNSLANWTSTSFYSAQEYPDKGVGLAKIKNAIIGGGGRSCEFFQDHGNPTGSPLQRVNGASIRVGLYSQRGFYEYRDTVYMIGMEADSVGIHQITGVGQFKKISTPAVDKYLDNKVAAGTTIYFAGHMNMHGMDHLVISFDGSEHLCYCVATNYWWYFSLAGSLVVKACGVTGTGSWFVTSTNGASQGRKIYTISPASPLNQDDGSNFTMTVQTQPLDFGTDRRKEFQSFTIIADTQTTAGNVQVSWSNDDYANFSTARNIDMIVQKKSIDAGLGWGRQRAWKITETVNRPFRARFMDIRYEVSEE